MTKLFNGFNVNVPQINRRIAENKMSLTFKSPEEVIKMVVVVVLVWLLFRRLVLIIFRYGFFVKWRSV